MRRVATLAACTLLAVVGCAGEDEQATPYSVGEVIDMHAALWETTEQYTAECMREQGFGYAMRPFPEDTMSVRAGVSDDLSDGVFDLRLPTVDSAQENGFGIVDGVLRAAGTPAAAAADPNLELRETMSELERAAWSAALDGDPVAGTPGCRAKAGEQARAEAGELIGIEQQISAFGEAIEADPRYERLQQQLSDCLAERGVDPPDLDQLRAELSQQATDLLRAAQEQGRPVDPQAAAALRERETAAATEAARCGEPLQQLLDEIVRDARAAAG